MKNSQGCSSNQRCFSVDGADKRSARISRTHIVGGLREIIGVIVIWRSDTNRIRMESLNISVLNTVILSENIHSSGLDRVQKLSNFNIPS